MVALAFIGSIGMQEGLIILVVGLLIFGSRLPEVGRSVGRGLMEFKKGLRGIQDEVRDLEYETDRELDAEMERRRREADPHDLAEDPRTPKLPDPPFAHEFVDGDPAAQESMRPAEVLEEDSSPEDEAATPAGEDAPIEEAPPEPDATSSEAAKSDLLDPRDPVEGSSAWGSTKPKPPVSEG